MIKYKRIKELYQFRKDNCRNLEYVVGNLSIVPIIAFNLDFTPQIKNNLIKKGVSYA